MSAPLVAVTDHAVERYRQRVRGGLDVKPEIAGRVSAAWAAGRVTKSRRRAPPPSAAPSTCVTATSPSSACGTARAASCWW